jgi:hypothetical protein
MKTKQTRSISDITVDILRDWKNVSPYAAPYLNAMAEIDKITDNYYSDSAQAVVAYFIANASSWKGEVARKIKAELKSLLDH